jgi:hypothetical protein
MRKKAQKEAVDSVATLQRCELAMIFPSFPRENRADGTNLCSRRRVVIRSHAFALLLVFSLFSQDLSASLSVLAVVAFTITARSFAYCSGCYAQRESLVAGVSKF